MRPRRLTLRARFALLATVLVVAAAPASIWTVAALSGLASTMEVLTQGSEEAMGATSRLVSAVEGEDDALLSALGDARPSAIKELGRARERTDLAGAQLGRLALADAEREAVRAALVAYREVADAALGAARDGTGAIAPYLRAVHEPLRELRERIDAIRVRHFTEARESASLARREVDDTLSIVAAVAAASLLIALFVAYHMARFVTRPLHKLTRSARGIGAGNFRVRVHVPQGDELGQVADAFNDMAQHLEARHQQTLSAILRSRDTLDLMMAALPDPVLLFDGAGRRVSANPAAESLFADSRGGLPSSTEALIALGVSAERVEAALSGRAADAAVDFSGAIELEVARQPRKLSVRLIPSSTAADPEGGLIAVLSDVTEIARLDAMRAELVAIASHELRTPVTTLGMSIGMLTEEREELAPRHARLIDAARTGIEQLAETVDELLDVTRIEAGKLRLDLERLDLGALAAEVIARSAPRADERGIEVALTCEGQSTIAGDRARVRLLLQNLLDNALKYASDGSAVTCVVRPEEDAVVVEVTDTGPGVPSPYRERIFEKFFRVEHVRPGDGDPRRGTGIGLYLCREIAHLHGGTILCLAGEGGRGARLRVTFPQA